jgi:uncharacterized protein YabN with tetrapyrrole methylase and pyrophosphatase domain
MGETTSRTRDELVIVGIGPGPVEHLTREAVGVLLDAERIWFRFASHPVYAWLEAEGKAPRSFHGLYGIPQMKYRDVYRFIARALIHDTKRFGRVVYALPGSPHVFEKTTTLLRRESERQDVAVRTVLGISFLDLMYSELDIDPVHGLQILNRGHLKWCAEHSGHAMFDGQVGIIVGQVASPPPNDRHSGRTLADIVVDGLTTVFPPSHRVTLVWSSGWPDYESPSQTFKLEELTEQIDRLGIEMASLYVPPIEPGG